jgi:hypothetical protein
MESGKNWPKFQRYLLPPLTALITEAVSRSETYSNFCVITRCNMPEDNHLQAYLNQLIKSEPKIWTELNMTVFWDVSPCSLVEIYRRFRCACCLHYQGSKYLWNVGKFLLDSKTQYPEWHSPSTSPLWEPEFLLNKITLCEILGSHGGEYEDDSLLGYCAV